MTEPPYALHLNKCRQWFYFFISLYLSTRPQLLCDKKTLIGLSYRPMKLYIYFLEQELLTC